MRMKFSGRFPDGHCASLHLGVRYGSVNVFCEVGVRSSIPAGLSHKEAELYSRLDPARFPQHTAIIMDGNGRWAKRRHLPRIAGHRSGVFAVRNTVQCASRIGLPAMDHFPTAAWAKLVNRHARHAAISDMVYAGPMGYPPLREAIAEYLATVRAVRCDASQIIITTGSQQGLQLCAHALLEAKDHVWMEDPGYPGARQALHTVGAQIVPVPVDDEGLHVDAAIRLSRHARAAYISPSHQFPLGVTMSASRRMQLLNWAARTGAWIIEDDYDSEYRFGGRPLASLQGMDGDDRVIYVGTFSKVMFPALRMGYIVVPKDLISAFAAVRDAFDTFSPTLYQAALTDFIRDGQFARHIRRMRALYLERRMALLDAIDHCMDGKLEVIGTHAGMQLAALLPRGIDDVALSIQTAKLGVSTRPLSICYARPPRRGGVILGYSGASVQEIREGVRKLRSCLSSN